MSKLQYMQNHWIGFESYFQWKRNARTHRRRQRKEGEEGTYEGIARAKKDEKIISCPVCMDQIENFTVNGYTLSYGHNFCRECLFGDFKNRVEGSIKFSLNNQIYP